MSAITLHIAQCQLQQWSCYFCSSSISRHFPPLLSSTHLLVNLLGVKMPFSAINDNKSISWKTGFSALIKHTPHVWVRDWLNTASALGNRSPGSDCSLVVCFISITSYHLFDITNPQLRKIRRLIGLRCYRCINDGTFWQCWHRLINGKWSRAQGCVRFSLRYS